MLKSAGEIFLSGLRGANNFSVAFRIVFRILFRVFQTVFPIDLEVFRGQFRSADMPPQYFHAFENLCSCVYELLVLVLIQNMPLGNLWLLYFDVAATTGTFL